MDKNQRLLILVGKIQCGSKKQSELLVELKQPSYSHFPFVYYSQILENADKGIAGQMEITPSE
ncbi:repressor protein for FtsI [Proteus mirabilis]|uniref:Repressor protein for FtsI n=1 Tax=Proteus mirabilis TaxID=584 RepID=A0A2X2DQ01_PROMI|nr:repressor protein for FtsI [Proteus mirabilis]